MNNHETAMLAFKEFQKALKNGLIKTGNGEVHKDLQVHFDSPEDSPRFTYALISKDGRVKSSCVAVVTDPHKGLLCFDVGVTTLEKLRGQGLATEVLAKSIDELKNGVARNGIEKFYIEFKVDKGNIASHKLCEKMADEIIDHDRSTTYMKLVTQACPDIGLISRVAV